MTYIHIHAHTHLTTYEGLLLRITYVHAEWISDDDDDDDESAQSPGGESAAKKGRAETRIPDGWRESEAERSTQL